MTRLVFFLALLCSVFALGMIDGLAETLSGIVFYILVGWGLLAGVIVGVVGVVFLLLALGDLLDRWLK